MSENRNDLLENKKNEIVSIIERTSREFGEEGISAKDIMQFFLENGGLLITPPQQEPLRVHMITIDSLNNFNKGESIKPGNIKLNIRRLIEHMPDITSATVGITMDIPILKVCAALNIWKMLRDVMTVKITKVQAIMLISLWVNCDQQHRITLEQGFDCFKSLYEQIEISECTWEQYINLINYLEKIDSLKLKNNGIWLCEWVSKKYIS
ncbi:MAG: hypothetical protein IJ661_07845 [Lachnospiraceae bacterium]|nr:hypothetical protein [Lachnospiraceae bacterium]